MKILGFPNRDIRIFTKEELIEKGTKRVNYIKGSVSVISLISSLEYDIKHAEENLEKLKAEPEPYCLFRYMELWNYGLVNIGIEINEEQYMERLEVLPPVPFKTDIYEGYIVPECTTDDIYEHIFEFKGKYYCVYLPCQNMKMMQGWF